MTRNKNSNKKQSKGRKRFGLFLLLPLLAAAALFIQLNTYPTNGAKSTTLFTISGGEPLAQIASRLRQEDLISSSLLFKALCRLDKSDRNVKWGTYKIEPGMSMLQIKESLLAGVTELVQITFKEGLTTSGVAEALEKAQVVDAKSFIEAVRTTTFEKYGFPEIRGADGFLFPETYRFSKGISAELVVNHMVSIFFKNLKRVAPQYEALPDEIFYKSVILASIVEKEYRVEKEAPLIASVFRNRLNAGWKLQSCATVLYVLTEELGQAHKKRLLYSDIEIPSHYNTYINSGLPPTPIANAGTVAISSVFNPVESNYFYFVVNDPTIGNHIFSQDYSEHLKGRELYINSTF